MIAVLFIKVDEFDVGAIGKADEGVMGAGEVPPARYDGEPLCGVFCFGLFQVGHADDNMVNSLDHNFSLRGLG